MLADQNEKMLMCSPYIKLINRLAVLTLKGPIITGQDTGHQHFCNAAGTESIIQITSSKRLMETDTNAPDQLENGNWNPKQLDLSL